MRYAGRRYKEETRKRVLKAAAKAIRAEGPHRVAVAGVMAEAGLTHGGFYAHFKSKDDLVAASIGQMFREGSWRIRREMESSDPAAGLSRYVDFYLSREHRDAKGAGCPLPYLSADAPRMDSASRARFAEGVAQMVENIGAMFARLDEPDPGHEREPRCSPTWSGALSLARADPDAARSDAILERSSMAIKTRFSLPAHPPEIRP